MKKHLIVLAGIVFIILSSCGKTFHISSKKIFLISKNVDRTPNFLFKNKIETYFEKWYDESIPISREELIKLDSLSILAYEIYDNLMSDTTLLKKLWINNRYEYVLVPNKIKVVLVDNPKFYYSSSSDSIISTHPLEIDKISKRTTIELENFRPRIKNRKCLYFNENRQNQFYKYARRHGVKPYILIDSPLMFGGYRFAETAPFVDEIIIYKNTNFVSIIYSAHTSDSESIFNYEQKKLDFIKEVWEIAVD